MPDREREEGVRVVNLAYLQREWEFPELTPEQEAELEPLRQKLVAKLEEELQRLFAAPMPGGLAIPELGTFRWPAGSGGVAKRCHCRIICICTLL